MFRSLAIKYDVMSRRLAEYVQKRKKNKQFGPIQDDAWRPAPCNTLMPWLGCVEADVRTKKEW
jgi:hypothetical protein